MTHPSWSVPEKLSHSPHGTGARCSSQDLAGLSSCPSTGTRGKRSRTNGKAGRCSPSDELGVRRTTRLDLKSMVPLTLCNYMVHEHGFSQLWIKTIREKEWYVVADVYHGVRLTMVSSVLNTHRIFFLVIIA